MLPAGVLPRRYNAIICVGGQTWDAVPGVHHGVANAKVSLAVHLTLDRQSPRKQSVFLGHPPRDKEELKEPPYAVVSLSYRRAARAGSGRFLQPPGAPRGQRSRNFAVRLQVDLVRQLQCERRSSMAVLGIHDKKPNPCFWRRAHPLGSGFATNDALLNNRILGSAFGKVFLNVEFRRFLGITLEKVREIVSRQRLIIGAQEGHNPNAYPGLRRRHIGIVNAFSFFICHDAPPPSAPRFQLRPTDSPPIGP